MKLPMRPKNRPSAGSGTVKSDRKSTRLNSSHSQISYAVFCLKKKNQKHQITPQCHHFLYTSAFHHTHHTLHTHHSTYSYYQYTPYSYLFHHTPLDFA